LEVLQKLLFGTTQLTPDLKSYCKTC